MRLRLFTTVLVLLVAGGIATAYFWFAPFALPGVEVASGVCDYSPSAETTVQSNWADPVLHLAIDQPENCGVMLRAISVQRIGGHLFVRTKYHSPSGMYTSCYCRHRTSLSIPDLPRQTYRAHVYSWP